MNQHSTQGTLYIVATPIGNLEDITLRAIRILKEVDLIAAEDTRHSQKLLQHYQIRTSCIPVHEHNEIKQVAKILEMLRHGKSIALISDAGTPLISDPGYRLITAAHAEQIKVVPIPGACAAITALSASGLPADHFIFAGFLSVKKQQRLNQLSTYKNETRTMIFYEAPHRMLELLDALHEVFGGEREITIARELTKTFETIMHGSIDELQNYYRAHQELSRGEFVVLVKGAEKSISNQPTFDSEMILRLLMKELPVNKAAALTAQLTGEKKNELYKLALTLKAH